MEPKILSQGKKFEKVEKAEWEGKKDAQRVLFEKNIITLGGRQGRADVFIEEFDGSFSIIEIKSTNWDRMKPHRVRPNAQRHIRQAFKYLMESHEMGIDVCLGICYPRSPLSQERRLEIEQIFEEKCVQIVWTSER